MKVSEVTETIGQRFHRPKAPTIIATARASKSPIVVSHVVSEVPTPEKTLAPPVEGAFAIHVHHRPLLSAETWIDGAHKSLPPIAAGGLCVFDLATSPVAFIREPFEFSRFYITRTTLADLAYHEGMPLVDELRIPEFGRVDPVIHHLALALITRQRSFGEEGDTLFADWIALAFHAHIVSAYGKSPKPRPRRGGLAPHRFRYISDWMIERLSDPISIAELAAQLDMTPGYFARAFRETAGEPPHRWLMRQRIERAKELLRTHDLSLAVIASACGFVDQSHFTRVFRCAVGRTPRQWRLANY